MQVVFEAESSDLRDGPLQGSSLTLAGRMYEATVIRFESTVYRAFVVARVAGDPNRELSEQGTFEDWDGAVQWAEQRIHRLHAQIGHSL